VKSGETGIDYSRQFTVQSVWCRQFQLAVYRWQMSYGVDRSFCSADYCNFYHYWSANRSVHQKEVILYER